MQLKTCIMCGETKPLSEYYAHPQMADGYLGRCKVCHRKEARRIRSENLERYREYDRQRGKSDERKLSYKIKNKNKRKFEGPIYDKAHNALVRAVKLGKIIRPDHCERCHITCVPQGHHDDYSKPLEVMWLCPICHAQRHRELGKLKVVDATLI